MNVRRIICVIGGDTKKKQLFIDKFKKQEGEYKFSDDKYNIKAFHEWIEINKKEEIFNIFNKTDKNLLINVRFLFDIPREIRLFSEIKQFNNDINIQSLLSKNDNTDQKLWKLYFQKFIPQDLQ